LNMTIDFHMSQLYGELFLNCGETLDTSLDSGRGFAWRAQPSAGQKIWFVKPQTAEYCTTTLLRSLSE
jgi:hypothetical protein